MAALENCNITDIDGNILENSQISSLTVDAGSSNAIDITTQEFYITPITNYVVAANKCSVSDISYNDNLGEFEFINGENGVIIHESIYRIVFSNTTEGGLEDINNKVKVEIDFHDDWELTSDTNVIIDVGCRATFFVEEPQVAELTINLTGQSVVSDAYFSDSSTGSAIDSITIELGVGEISIPTQTFYIIPNNNFVISASDISVGGTTASATTDSVDSGISVNWSAGTTLLNQGLAAADQGIILHNNSSNEYASNSYVIVQVNFDSAYSIDQNTTINLDIDGKALLFGYGERRVSIMEPFASTTYPTTIDFTLGSESAGNTAVSLVNNTEYVNKPDGIINTLNNGSVDHRYFSFKSEGEYPVLVSTVDISATQQEGYINFLKLNDLRFVSPDNNPVTNQSVGTWEMLPAVEGTSNVDYTVSEATNIIINIGDSYEGGTVFHIDTSTQEALVFFNYSEQYGTTHQLGAGFANNSQDIASSFTIDGYDDWRLPTLSECQLLYANISSFPDFYNINENYQVSHGGGGGGGYYEFNFNTGISSTDTAQSDFNHVLLVRNVTNITEATSTPATYTVGQAIKGGVVFHIADDYVYIVDKNDLPETINADRQHFVGTESVDDSSYIEDYHAILSGAIGSGKSNTEWLDLRIRPSAVRACSELTLNGYNDWLLPSINLLSQLRNVWNNNSLMSGITNGTHWSSTPNNNHQKSTRFSDNATHYNLPESDFEVVAVRHIPYDSSLTIGDLHGGGIVVTDSTHSTTYTWISAQTDINRPGFGGSIPWRFRFLMQGWDETNGVHHDATGCNNYAKAQGHANYDVIDATVANNEFWMSKDYLPASKACLNHTVTEDGVTYDDWFLPSRDELEEIYDNKSTLEAVDSFQSFHVLESDRYLSSTGSVVFNNPNGHRIFWYMYDPGISQAVNEGAWGTNVRPIRRFVPEDNLALVYNTEEVVNTQTLFNHVTYMTGDNGQSYPVTALYNLYYTTTNQDQIHTINWPVDATHTTTPVLTGNEWYEGISYKIELDVDRIGVVSKGIDSTITNEITNITNNLSSLAYGSSNIIPAIGITKKDDIVVKVHGTPGAKFKVVFQEVETTSATTGKSIVSESGYFDNIIPDMPEGVVEIPKSGVYSFNFPPISSHTTGDYKTFDMTITSDANTTIRSSAVKRNGTSEKVDNLNAIVVNKFYQYINPAITVTATNGSWNWVSSYDAHPGGVVDSIGHGRPGLKISKASWIKDNKSRKHFTIRVTGSGTFSVNSDYTLNSSIFAALYDDALDSVSFTNLKATIPGSGLAQLTGTISYRNFGIKNQTYTVDLTKVFTLTP